MEIIRFFGHCAASLVLAIIVFLFAYLFHLLNLWAVKLELPVIFQMGFKAIEYITMIFDMTYLLIALCREFLILIKGEFNEKPNT